MLAVILVALILTLFYWSQVRGLQKERDILRIADLTRQQAAEIVTTVYLAHLTAYAPDVAGREKFRRQLDQAIRQLEKRRRVLGLKSASTDVSDDTKAVLRQVYLGERNIDEQMEVFLRDARDVLKSGGGVTELKNLARKRTTLLPALIHLHERLRAEHEAAYNRLRLLASVDWLTALTGLAVVVVLILRPTTRRAEQLMEELWRAKEVARERATAADAARKAQANFIRTMNHELRTPLNAVLGMAQLLRMRNLPPREDGYARDIQQAGEHLLGLINNVLDLARIEANQVTISRKPTTLIGLLERATGMLRPLAAQKSLDLRCRCSDELSGLYLADDTHIHQVLVNLGNAIKFTEEGWIEARAVSAGPEEAGFTPVRFEVEDTGIGVPRERREAIFEEFQQANQMLAKNYEGTGLGLAISRALIHLMGGEIGLDSEREKGSLFWFILPMERPPLNESPATRA